MGNRSFLFVVMGTDSLSAVTGWTVRVFRKGCHSPQTGRGLSWVGEIKCRLFFLFFCIWIYTFFPRSPEEDLGSSGTRAVECCEPPRECWDLNLSPLEEQPVSAPNKLSHFSSPRGAMFLFFVFHTGRDNVLNKEVDRDRVIQCNSPSKFLYSILPFHLSLLFFCFALFIGALRVSCSLG